MIGDVVVVWNAHAENAHADWRRKAFFMVEFIMSVILLTLAPLLVEMEGNGKWEYREWIISAPMGRHKVGTSKLLSKMGGEIHSQQR